MKLGNLDIKDIYVGSTPAAQVYFGDVKVWPEETPAAGYWGLCFTSEEPGATVSMTKTGTPPSVSLLYSTDASTWDTFTPGTTTVTLANAGDKMWLKAGSGGNTAFATDLSNYWRFVTSKANASGNIMSLLDGEQQQTSLSATYCFSYLFSGSSTKTAPELPATTLASNCYRNMFKGCTSLTSAPALLAPTLVGGCYHSMFYGCTSLSAAPAMSATTLANNCCVSMFNECSSLTSAPELPAKTLAERCYQYMFQNCSSLATAPALPATTLASNCYNAMFHNCTSLTAAPELQATVLSSNCYSSMFYNCTSLASMDVSFTAWSPAGATNNWLYSAGSQATGTKTFTCPTALGTDTTITRGSSNCPNGWTVVNPTNG